MAYRIRTVQADEWLTAKELTLTALTDPVAPIAFATTVQDVAGQPDSFWQERAERVSHGTFARQFIAEGPDGHWAGTVVVLVERPGGEDFFDMPVRSPQAHLVGVFLRPENRGSGLIEQLFEAGMKWAWSLEEPVVGRVRLFVHDDNRRAAAFYRRFGFVATGVTVGADREMEIPRP
ncbi:GNAT family N-acetyltransferase [Streptomyces sp. NPDC020802]|uniref:GNAT family N-acetyltransferase n=1 Tax=Streptomyces sp. NPDC020802 TaxID=3365094 RepID=UPI00378B737F